MCSSMRLVVFIFLCFAASTAVNSTHRNNSGASDYEVKKAIPSQMVGLSDESPSASSSTMNRRLKRDDPEQPDWCQNLVQGSPVNDILTNCKELESKSDDYVLQVQGPENNGALEKFIKEVTKLKVNMKITGSSLTELNFDSLYDIGSYDFRRSVTISNNEFLKSINIRQSDLDWLANKLEFTGNPELTSIRFEVKEFGTGLTLKNNPKLEKLEIVATIQHVQDWFFEKNPRLRILNIVKGFQWNEVMGPIQIIENDALTKLDFSVFNNKWESRDIIKIVNNKNLERVIFPKEILAHPSRPEESHIFKAHKLEIKQNPKLTSIKLGKLEKWSETEVIVRENPLLSSEDLETLNKIGKSRDIQKFGEPINLTPIQVAGGTDGGGMGGGFGGGGSDYENGEEVIPAILLSSLLILGYSLA